MHERGNRNELRARESGRWRRFVVRWCVVAALVGAGSASLPIAAAAEWEPPVANDISDPFRPPATRFGAGNRGLEYATTGGEPVRAVDDGRVTFAGPVGRRLHVVIDHGNDLRSTYAFVRSVAVIRGQRVRAGDIVAVADPGLHLTARLGDSYVDPRLLFAGARVELALVPAPAADQARRTTAGRLDPFAAVVDAAGDLAFSSQIEAAAGAALAWHHQDCTDDDTSIPTASPGGRVADGRILVQVGGLGSSSGHASVGSIAAEQIGYDPGDIVGFSYAGGCSPKAFDRETVGSSLAAELTTSVYEPSDTHQDIDVSAARLADLVDEIAAVRPGQPIDIAAHSLGGVVTRRALELLEIRHADSIPVSVVLTVASPHSGADLATTAVATSGSNGIAHLLDPILPGDGAIRSAPSVAQVSEAGGAELPPPGPPPDDVRVVAVAGADDLVVPAEHAIWPGAVNTLVGPSFADGSHAHAAITASPQVLRELELAVAGSAPRCVALGTIIGSALVGRAVSATEDLATVAVGVVRWLL